MDPDILKEGTGGQAVKLLSDMLGKKADSYEIFLSLDKGIAVEVKDGEVDSFKVRSSLGVGIRTLSAGRAGFGYSSLLDPFALRDMVDKALSGSLELPIDRNLSFPGSDEHGGGGDEGTGIVEESELIDPSIGEGGGEGGIECASLIEESARATDKRVKNIRKSSYTESSLSTRLVNSNGIDSLYSATFFSGSISVVAEQDGESQMGWEIAMGHKRADVDPELVGRGAARRATALLGARKAESTRSPAVMENLMAMELLQAFSGAFLGDNVSKGKSMLAGLLNKEVVSKIININDDGLLKGGWATSAFDGEGVGRRKTQLIKEGRLAGFLYDTYWAKLSGAESTGNGSRSSFKSVPAVGVSNLYIEAGERGLDELLKEMDTGFFITELMGVHTINTITGEFSLGAQGFRVEGGELKYPVRSMAIAGELLGLFSRVEEVGSDLRFIGGTGAPSLRLSELDISGAS